MNRRDMFSRLDGRSGTVGSDHHRRRRDRRRRRRRCRVSRVRGPAGRAERLRKGHFEPQHQAACTAACAISSRATFRSCWRRSRSAAFCVRTRRTSSSDLAFVVPNYDWWEAPFYGLGLKVYDLLAGKYGFGSSQILSREETLKRLPTIKTEGLRGGVVYYDGQFDDARLLINLVADGGGAGRDAAELRARDRIHQGSRWLSRWCRGQGRGNGQQSFT